MKILPIILLMLLQSLTQAASFECSDAKICIEKLICDNSELNIIDEQLGDIYRPLRDALLPNSIEQQKFIRGQRIWLNLRDSLCSLNIDCLIGMYQERIAFLQNTASSFSNEPSEKLPTIPHTSIDIKTSDSLPQNQLLSRQWKEWEMTCFPWKKHNLSKEEAYCANITTLTKANNITIACFTWEELKSASNLISHCLSAAMLEQVHKTKGLQ